MDATQFGEDFRYKKITDLYTYASKFQWRSFDAEILDYIWAFYMKNEVEIGVNWN